MFGSGAETSSRRSREAYRRVAKNRSRVGSHDHSETPVERSKACVAGIHIGTSGWHYDHWIGPFYPPDTRSADFFAYYARCFRTVEINNTFYRLPSREAVLAWRDASPSDFVFAAKGSRFITHMKKLKDPEVGLRRFLDRLSFLGEKLGPIVFQLPPRWRLNLERLEAFLKVLPASRQYAFEFRDESWFCSETLQVLAQHRAALCLFELGGHAAPIEVTADFTYIRLHGPGGPYQGNYSDKDLAVWAERMTDWRTHRISSYCYFDNDDRGYAPRNALRLARMIEERE
jgi:uncharacterized protein YecE (DUF72 family)